MVSEVSAPPIVLIHGLWLTPRSWEGWKGLCENRGHRVLAPAWPRMPGEVEDVRRDPSAYNFTNTMAQDKAKAAYDRYHVPGPGRGGRGLCARLGRPPHQSDDAERVSNRRPSPG